ncbi:MAG: sigma-70 family RNA polymerase sigma factor [Candidatus Krumholzibacteria bacterium]|nr:sigma-70 family RNA polymerase sigma factor [Candidatus Krumholzibacteria bacterium]
MNISDSNPKIITRLLNEASKGNQKAASELLPLVYRDLHALASRRMASERPEHTLQATALVHEAYLRLVGTQQTTWKGKGQFCLAAAEAMRRILIEYARKRGRVKRGGDYKRVSLDIEVLAREAQPEEIMAVDEAICRLEQKDTRLGEIVRLRFFVGLSVAETAAALGISDRTVRREWALARAWLSRELKDD